MDFSLVVCTYKRYELVRNCLRAIARLVVPGGLSFEVIVVENTPPKDRLSLDWVGAFPKSRVVVEDRPGLSQARNAGIAAALGGVIVFLDDDAEVHAGWLVQMQAAFARHPHALVVGGKVSAKYPEGARPDWVSRKCEELLSCIDWGDRTRPLAVPREWLVGANIAYRREVFERFGRFGTELGRKGESTLLSNEESEFNARLPEGAVFYCGAAVVDHLIPPERLSPEWFRKRVFWQAVSDAIAGNVDRKTAQYHFEEYRGGLLKVPAEHRSARSLFYRCQEAGEFEHQLGQLYSQTVALAMGTCAWPEAVS